MNNANWEHLTFCFSDFIILLKKYYCVKYISLRKNLTAANTKWHCSIFGSSRSWKNYKKSYKANAGIVALAPTTWPATHSWLAEHGVVPGPGDRLHQPSNQPLDSPQQHQQGHSLPSLTLIHMAPVQGLTSMAPSSKINGHVRRRHLSE